MWEIFNRNLDQSKDEQNIYILDHGIDFCSVCIGYKPNTGLGLSIRGDTRYFYPPKMFKIYNTV